MNTHQRVIAVGDYADIIYGKIIIGQINTAHRYYIIKIEDNKIEIAQVNDPTKILILIKIKDDWRIKGYDKDHAVIFDKNTTDIYYLERDFTKAPSKIITIAEKNITTFTELKNGIILYISRPNEVFNFADYTRTGNLIPANRSVDAKSFDLAKAFTFYKTPITKDEQIYTLFNMDDEIFVHSYATKAISKLNTDDLTLTEYDRNPKLLTLFPLKYKKFLCFLDDDTVYIFDLTTKQRIPIVGTISEPIVKQLFNGDVILRDFEHMRKIYRIDINTAILNKITKFKQSIEFISGLQDNTILVYNNDSGMIQIWDIATNQFTDIFPLVYEEDADIDPENNAIVNILLTNGDVLFFVDKQYYLFSYATKQIVKLHLMKNKYTKGVEIGGAITQLKNGNLLINNGKHLSVIEFPVTQRIMDRLNYDKIQNNSVLAPDIKGLIREHL